MSENSQETRYPFQFLGSGSEYFRIWIVNIVLTILTLYIYSAWAKVRTKRFFYGNTALDESAFEYHATPMQILKGRIVAVVFLLIVGVASVINPIIYGVMLVLLALVTPWVIWRSIKFNRKMSSYRNVRFNFSGKCFSLYKIFLLQLAPIIIGALLVAVLYSQGNVNALAGIIGLASLAVYLIFPLVQKIMTQYVVDHSRYGLSAFKSALRASRYYVIYILSILLSIVAFIVIAALLAGSVIAIALAAGIISTDMLSAENAGDQILTALESSGEPYLFLFGILGALAYLLPLTLVFAYVKTRIRNTVFNNTTLPAHVRLESTLKVRSYWWLVLSNILLLIVTLGLAYPWTKVRKARILADNTAVYSTRPLDHFVSEIESKSSALGEELGEAFDLDLDLGF